MLYRGEEGRAKLWPLIVGQFKHWCVGPEIDNGCGWKPCEALVRIACHELFRLPYRMFTNAEFSDLPHSEQHVWANTFLDSFAGLLTSSIAEEDKLIQKLLDAREQTNSIQLTDDFDADEMSPKVVVQPFGNGVLLKCVESSETHVMTQIIELDFGGILYRPIDRDSELSEAMNPSQIPEAGIPYEVDGTL